MKEKPPIETTQISPLLYLFGISIDCCAQNTELPFCYLTPRFQFLKVRRIAQIIEIALSHYPLRLRPNFEKLLLGSYTPVSVPHLKTFSWSKPTNINIVQTDKQYSVANHIYSVVY